MNPGKLSGLGVALVMIAAVASVATDLSREWPTYGDPDDVSDADGRQFLVIASSGGAFSIIP